jgi:hypothetical protein
MLPLMHLDGCDVVVIDHHGHEVRAVEVRLEPGLAVVAVDPSERDWLQALLRRASHETLAGSVHAVSDGHLHHCGALRLRLVVDA